MTDVQVNIDKRYVKVFEFVDNQLVHGTIAFSSFGISFLLIDNIVVVPIPCTDFNQDKSEVQQIITPTCPRFSENFKNNYLSRWTALEPIQSINGPSSWKILNNEDNREIILSQESKISGLSEYEEGTIYLLKDKNMIKVCTIGEVSIKFKAFNEGIVGIVFKYNDNGNFYIVEISGEKEKYVRIRKKFNGLMELISIKSLIGYTIGNWHTLIVKIVNNGFDVYITNRFLHDSIIKVFDNTIFDSDLKLGFVGISTYKTKAYFTDISLSPFDDLDSINNILY